MTANRNRSIQSLERAFDILDLFKRETFQELSLKDICAATDLHASTAHHLIATMVSRGYMAQDPDSRRYLLGPELLRFRAAAMDGSSLLRTAHPIVRKLMQSTQEEAFLEILRGWHSVSLITLPSPQPVRVVRPEGAKPSLHATASGKVHLAFGMPGLLDRYIQEVSLTPFTQNTITQAACLRNEIEQIRTTGIAHDREEHVNGVGCIAAPIQEETGKKVAVLSISYPTFRADVTMIDKWTCDVQLCARAISERIGYASDWVDDPPA